MLSEAHGVSLRITSGVRELYTTFFTLAGKIWWRGRSWVFDLSKSDLCPSFVEGLTPKGLGFRVADSHTRNYLEDNFTPLKTIRRFQSTIGRRSHSSSKVSPEHVPIQYDRMSVDYCDCKPEFTIDGPAAVVTVKPTTKQTAKGNRQPNDSIEAYIVLYMHQLLGRFRFSKHIRDCDRFEVTPINGSGIGPESFEFSPFDDTGPYTGVSDGRIIKWISSDRRWTDFAVTSPHR
ncbi:strictosidine synthase-like 10-like protein [Tanacetum coccineum]